MFSAVVGFQDEGTRAETKTHHQYGIGEKRTDPSQGNLMIKNCLFIHKHWVCWGDTSVPIAEAPDSQRNLT